DLLCLSELRIVLLGYRYAGKSSAGNTILNREEFELKGTAQCVKRQGEVAGRHITVVEAPGWWRDEPVEESTELLKQEIVLSVSLCPPGPHAVLLIIRLDRVFNRNYRRILEGYLNLLTDTVWSHTIVLFTCGDCLEDTPIEQHIESEGKELQWLVEKCGNRYHVLNNENRSDDTQVTELLEKIEEMVAANGGHHFGQLRMGMTIREKETKEKEVFERRSSHMCLVFMVLLLCRFLCPHAGQFQCRLTNLMFEMEGKGEVLYRIDHWDTRLLDGLGQMQPAGPLYNIDCFEGSISRLHLPHCEVQYGENQEELAVAHLTGDNIEVIWPLKVTDTHVVISIQGLSFFGLLKKMMTFSIPINGQVLLFYKELTGKRIRKKLHVHLLPGNVPVEEVQNQHMDFRKIKTSSKCQLIPGKKYKPSCDPYVFQPKVEVFDCDYGPNYHPTFEVFLDPEAQEVTIGLLKENGQDVWDPRLVFLADDDTEAATYKMDSAAGDKDHHISLRIVLLGSVYAGKSSAGNTILNREEFELKRTAQCVKRQGEVAGRHITVVEAPGWWINRPVEESTELLKQEIVLSVSLCPPGPHCLLLVIRLDRQFQENSRRILEQHLKHLTDTVWSHSILLFTRGDYLGDTPIEQHIESEGKELQWLVEKCGNRYHVLNNKNRSDDTQVTELLEKIEEMVEANSGRHFEMDRKILQVEQERMMTVQKQQIRSTTGDKHHLSELRIVLLGSIYAGRSSAGNTILNREEFELKRTAQCVKRQGEVAGRHITVVEAPGWWINRPVEESTELLKQEIVLSVSLCPPGPHALLLIIRMDRQFQENSRRILEQHLNLLTDTVWSHTIVLFTRGDCLGDTPIEQHIESEGKELQWLVEKCGNRYHVLNNKNRNDDTQVTELLEKIEEMVAANSGRHFEMDRKIPQEGEEKRRAEEIRGKERVKVEKQIEDIRSWMVSKEWSSDTSYLGALVRTRCGPLSQSACSMGATYLSKFGSTEIITESSPFERIASM
ncbi:hypothetical protein NFI96_018533, partial [Prochilodus magdalenae]